MIVVCFSDRPDETIVPRGESGEILIPERGLKKLSTLLSLLLAGVFQQTFRAGDNILSRIDKRGSVASDGECGGHGSRGRSLDDGLSVVILY